MELALQASIVLPTHGRRASLLRVLRALGRQNVPPETFEVVVVCDGDVDGSGDACRALAEALPYRLRVIEQPNQGPAVARNRGVAEAEAPLIVFIDDDVVPDEQLVGTHLAAQNGQDARVAVGPLLPPPDFRLNAWGTWEEAMLIRQYDQIVSGRWQMTYRQFYTGNASILKRHIVEAGGFNAEFRRAEDVELGLRLHYRGLHFAFVPRARGWHYVWRSFASWQRMAEAYGEADVELARSIRPWVLDLVARDFTRRHRINRAMAMLCAGRPLVVASTAGVLGYAARLTHALRLKKLANGACSLVFHLRYYNGLVHGLGSREAFRQLVRGGAESSTDSSQSDRTLASTR